MKIFQKLTVVELVLSALVLTLCIFVCNLQIKIERINELLELDGMSNDVFTSFMGDENAINLKLLERIEDLEEFDRGQVEFNHQILSRIEN